jgi:subtilisin family serine protease
MPSRGEAANSGALEASLDKLRMDERIDVGSHVYTTSGDGVPFVPTGELYVVFKEGVPPSRCNEILDEHKLAVVEARDEKTAVVRVTPGSRNPMHVAAQLQANPDVQVAEPDLATPGELAGFDLPLGEALLERQWHLRNSGAIGGASFGLKEGADARVLAAWKKAGTLGSPKVIVAVIDDGFDITHPDLSLPGKVVAPWDFTRSSADPSPAHGSDGDWHGTACAGVAVAAANGTGVLGVAPGCRLMPVRWGTSLSDSQIERWFRHVTSNGADVVSCSWKARARIHSLSERAIAAISQCATQGRGGKGCVVCFAAGNDAEDIDAPGRSVNGFANHPDVIAVAASTSRDEKASYSNFGRCISVCAPSSGAGGVAITTADVTGTYLDGGRLHEAGYGVGAYTHEFGGTSSATPLVAGVCALLLSIAPELTARKVADIVRKTARKIGPATAYKGGHSGIFGHGCVDAEAAVSYVMGMQAAQEG